MELGPRFAPLFTREPTERRLKNGKNGVEREKKTRNVAGPTRLLGALSLPQPSLSLFPHSEPRPASRPTLAKTNFDRRTPEARWVGKVPTLQTEPQREKKNENASWRTKKKKHEMLTLPPFKAPPFGAPLCLVFGPGLLHFPRRTPFVPNTPETAVTSNDTCLKILLCRHVVLCAQESKLSSWVVELVGLLTCERVVRRHGAILIDHFADAQLFF